MLVWFLAGLFLIAAGQESGGTPDVPSATPPPWNVHWGERYCSVIHHPRAEPDLTIVIRVVPRSGTIDLLFTRSAWATNHRGPNELRVSMEDGTALTTGSLQPLLFARPDQPPLVGARVARGDVERALAGSRLSLMARGTAVAFIEPPRSARVRTALKDCEDAQVSAWGFDPGAPAAVLIDPASLFNEGNYPAAAMRNGQQGMVQFLLAAQPDGQILDCRIVSGSGHADLDEATCSAARRGARFQPFEGPPRIVVLTTVWAISRGSTVLFVP